MTTSRERYQAIPRPTPASMPMHARKCGRQRPRRRPSAVRAGAAHITGPSRRAEMTLDRLGRLRHSARRPGRSCRLRPDQDRHGRRRTPGNGCGLHGSCGIVMPNLGRLTWLGGRRFWPTPFGAVIGRVTPLWLPGGRRDDRSCFVSAILPSSPPSAPPARAATVEGGAAGAPRRASVSTAASTLAALPLSAASQHFVAWRGH